MWVPGSKGCAGAPPADAEYAVEPSDVAVMRPSQINFLQCCVHRCQLEDWRNTSSSRDINIIDCISMNLVCHEDVPQEWSSNERGSRVFAIQSAIRWKSALLFNEIPMYLN